MITPVMLAGCEKNLSTVHPAGPAAAIIAELWWIMLMGATLIFVLVMVLLGLSLRRPAGSAHVASEQKREGVWIVGLGLGFPLTVLAMLFGYGIAIGDRLLPHPGPDITRVGAQARQWDWTFTYEDVPGRVTNGVLNIPAGRPVDVAITTADVIHSFWVPRLAGKLDAIPGHVNVLRIEAWEPGAYAGVSAEYNGPGYEAHGFAVVAHDKASWDAFVRGDGR